MEENLLNDDFIDFVSSQMQKNSYLLNKIDEYKKYNKKYLIINKIIEKMTYKPSKLFLEEIVNCYDIIGLYENAFAYYLGMQHIANMKKLENS